MEEWIKKSDAIEAIKSLVIIHTESRYLNDLEYGHNEGLAHAIDRIEDIPSADRPQGEWIERKERTIVRNDNFVDFFPTEYECSNCGLRRATYFINSPLSNYCPNCGAHMKGADDEDN